MKALQELAVWSNGREGDQEVLMPSTLPDPYFQYQGRTFVSFSTNNYLDLANSPRLVSAAHKALDRYGVGNCESRLLGGDLELYHVLEKRLANVKHKETSVLFATGYLTNISVLPALVKASQLARAFGYMPQTTWKYAFFTDEFNHLSIREGIKASGAPSFAFRHVDMDDLEAKLRSVTAGIKIIVTDGVFSQHGDIAPIPAMLELAERYDAVIYIDDAHGTGVIGPTGAGTTEYFGVESDRIIQMGTLSKAYGCIGGFVATEGYIAKILQIACSGYGFTSTLPPDQAAALIEAIDMVVDEPERRERMWANQRYFVKAMIDAGFTLLSTETPIVPLHMGDERECVRVARALHDEGIHVDSIMFPAVAMGQSRLRFIMNAGHQASDIDRVVATLVAAR
jgi:glycine C-acetyltransferase